VTKESGSHLRQRPANRSYLYPRGGNICLGRSFTHDRRRPCSDCPADEVVPVGLFSPNGGEQGS
jgi:hypothetical protein